MQEVGGSARWQARAHPHSQLPHAVQHRIERRRRVLALAVRQPKVLRHRALRSRRVGFAGLGATGLRDRQTDEQLPGSRARCICLP